MNKPFLPAAAQALAPQTLAPSPADGSVRHVLSELATLERMRRLEIAEMRGAPVAGPERGHRLRQIEERYRGARAALARQLEALHQARLNEVMFGGPVPLASMNEGAPPP